MANEFPIHYPTLDSIKDLLATEIKKLCLGIMIIDLKYHIGKNYHVLDLLNYFYQRNYDLVFEIVIHRRQVSRTCFLLRNAEKVRLI